MGSTSEGVGPHPRGLAVFTSCPGVPNHGESLQLTAAILV